VANRFFSAKRKKLMLLGLARPRTVEHVVDDNQLADGIGDACDDLTASSLADFRLVSLIEKSSADVMPLN